MKKNVNKVKLLIAMLWIVAGFCAPAVSNAQITIVQQPQDLVLSCYDDNKPETVNEYVNWRSNFGYAVLSSPCSGIDTFFIEGKVPEDICGGTQLHTWTFIDFDCKDTLTISASLTIKDTIAPEIQNFQDTIRIAVNENWPTRSTSLYAVDNCSGTYLFGHPTDQITGNIMTRIYRVYDDCGNFNDYRQLIIKENPQQGGSIQFSTVAKDIAIGCLDNEKGLRELYEWLDNHGGAVASSSCSGPLSWTHNYQVGQRMTMPCSDAVNITFVVSDGCGNSSATTATFFVEDVTPPTWRYFPDPVLEICESTFPAPYSNEELEEFITENCSGYFGRWIDGQDLVTGNVMSRLYVAYDDCGNSDSLRQTIILRCGETAKPSNLTVNCFNNTTNRTINQWISSGGGAAPNSYSSVRSSFVEIVTIQETAKKYGSFYNIDIPIQFVYTYENGNIETKVAYLRIEDTQNPWFTDITPVDITLDYRPSPKEIFDIAKAMKDEFKGEDDCGLAYVAHLECREISDTKVLLIFQVIDDAGNKSGTQTRALCYPPTVIPPRDTITFISQPRSLSLQCGEGDDRETILNWYASGGFAVITENVTISHDQQSLYETCSTDKVVTFTYTRESGLAVSRSVQLQVVDTVDPVWVNKTLPDLQLRCDQIYDGRTQLSLLSGEDNCSDSYAVHTACDYLPDGSILGKFVLTDCCGNTASDTVFQLVTFENSVLEFADITTQPRCPGDKGRISLALPDSVVVRWSTGATSSSIDNLDAGEYSVEITSLTGCGFATGSFTIQSPQSVEVDADITQPTCSNGLGSIQLFASSDVTFSWNTGSNDPFLDNVQPGTYVVTATNSVGCSITRTFQIVGVQPLSVESMTRPASCNGAQGIVVVNIQGGSYPYEFLWSDGSTKGYGVGVGELTVTITDANGCSVTEQFFIPEPELLEVDVTNITPVSCQTGADGTTTLQIQGGSGLYTVSRLVDDELIELGITNSEITVNLPDGEHVLLIVDENGCQTVQVIDMFCDGCILEMRGNRLYVSVYDTDSEAITIEIFNMTGARVALFTLPLNNGIGEDLFDLDQLPSGTYIARAYLSNDRTKSVKIIKT